MSDRPPLPPQALLSIKIVELLNGNEENTALAALLLVIRFHMEKNGCSVSAQRTAMDRLAYYLGHCETCSAIILDMAVPDLDLAIAPVVGHA